MAILLPSRFNLQPQYAAPIDYQGLGKGMQILLNPALGMVDLVTGRTWSATGDVTIDSVSRGKVYDFPGVAGGIAYTGYPEITGTKGTFFIWCPTIGFPDDFGHLLFGDASTFFLYQVGTGLFYNHGTPSNEFIPWHSATNRSLVATSASSTGAGLKTYVSGEDTAVTFSGSPVAWAAGSKSFTVGKYVGGTVHDFKGTIRIVGYTTAVWGAAEAKAFHENPWQIFKAPSRRIWTVPSAVDVIGTVAYTNIDDTSSASGTTTVTGSSATTNANDTSAAQGTTTVTGSSATTNANDTSAATGSPVVDGTSATTNADDTSSASGSVGSSVVGSVAYTNIDDVSAASGTTTVVGAGASSNLDDVSSASGTTTVIGTSATTNANDVSSATGEVSEEEIIGTVDYTNADDISAASGTTTIIGASTTTNTNDVSAAFGVVNNGTIVEAGLTSGSVTTIRIKKPGIPAGTPDWLKTMIEIVTGRRGNKIDIPKFQTLDFSATPTKDEVEALYAYTNKTRDALEQLINRLDS